jgi:hypothetical protein
LSVVVANWLYPLSIRSDFHFIDAAGNHLPDGGFDSFVKLVRNTTHEHWRLATNFKQVQPHDRLWAYYGRSDGDRGIVGLGVITAIEPQADGTPAVRFRWDTGRTKKLIRNPVPAPRVRHFLPVPRSAVQGLDRFAQLVAELERHAGL